MPPIPNPKIKQTVKNEKQLSLPWYTGSVFTMIFLVVLYHQSGTHQKTEANLASMLPAMARPANTAALPAGVVRMMGTRQVFTGPQLTADELTRFLASYQIDHVIDLAQEVKAEAKLTNATERFIVEKTGATYWPLNIEGAGSQLNNKVLSQIDSLLDSGAPVFLHCLHGIHRVGVAKGRAYARDGRNWPEIIALLRWEKVIDTPIYDRYTYNVRSAVVKYGIALNEKR